MHFFSKHAIEKQNLNAENKYEITTDIPGQRRAPCFRSIEQDLSILFIAWVLQMALEIWTKIAPPLATLAYLCLEVLGGMVWFSFKHNGLHGDLWFRS